MNATDINTILTQWDGYICSVARHYIRQYRQTQSVDIEDLAQQARIKLWVALGEREITNQKTYIRRVVHNTVIDMIRRKQEALPLLLNEEGELRREHAVASSSEDFQDPALLVEQAETIHDSLERTVEMVCALPPCQRDAMLCALKDRVDDLLLLKAIFDKNHLHIKDIRWPQEKLQYTRLRASLSVSRKKLRAMLMPTIAM